MCDAKKLDKLTGEFGLFKAGRLAPRGRANKLWEKREWSFRRTILHIPCTKERETSLVHIRIFQGKKQITRREPQRGLQVSDAERSLAHVCLCACLRSLSVRHSRGREARWVRTNDERTKETIRSSWERTNERKKLFVRRWNEGTRERNYWFWHASLRDE